MRKQQTLTLDLDGQITCPCGRIILPAGPQFLLQDDSTYTDHELEHGHDAKCLLTIFSSKQDNVPIMCRQNHQALGVSISYCVDIKHLL